MTTTQESMEMIRQSAKDFAETHIRPYMMEWDESQYFPVETMRELGRHGFWAFWYLKNMAGPDWVIRSILQ